MSNSFNALDSIGGFDLFPIVCITKEQIDDYCSWRTDRVLEALLIRSGLLTIQKGNDEIFTVEAYKNRSLSRVKKYKSMIYPVFTLPTRAEWNIIYSSTEATSTMNDKGVKTMKEVYDGCKRLASKEVILGFDCNVSEFLSNGTLAGKSYGEYQFAAEELSVKREYYPYVGFRCITRFEEIRF